jgi:hypothetical protein
LVELHKVFCDLLTIVHLEVLELGLSFAFRVVQSKVDLQVKHKLLIVGEPGWLVNQISLKERGFKPI